MNKNTSAQYRVKTKRIELSFIWFKTQKSTASIQLTSFLWAKPSEIEDLLMRRYNNSWMNLNVALIFDGVLRYKFEKKKLGTFSFLIPFLNYTCRRKINFHFLTVQLSEVMSTASNSYLNIIRLGYTGIWKGTFINNKK